VDRLERLVNLVAALLDTERPLTRSQIHARIEGYSGDTDAFRRNFERDKELLRQIGMPLVTEPLDPNHPDEVGYRIPREEYELPDPGLDEAELTALRLAASAVQVEGAWGDDAITRALRKLGGAATATDDAEGSRGSSSDAGWARVAALPGEDAAAVAFAAIGDRRRLRFAYRGKDRTVDPWRMSFNRGHWYLAGFDHGAREERLFRLDRVEGPMGGEGAAGAFDRPAAAVAKPPPAWRLGEDDEVVAELVVDAVQAPWAEAEFGADAVRSRRDDGSVLFAVPVTNRAAFRSLVLGFLDHAEVIGPSALRDDMVTWLAGIGATADSVAASGPSDG
jgi:predicted DNA-binding transcriptional regulator YafY